jgi:hypothetical protein
MSGVIIAGNVSGSVTLDAPAVSGSTVITLPTTSGTMATLTTPSFTTTIGVGNATPSTSGAGITFPATQSASTNANTLDDYEEGSWTPNQGAGLTVVGAFGSSGYYVKIGSVVTFKATLTGATSIALASAGQVCTNLPFSSTNTAAANAGGLFNNATVASICYVNPNSGVVYNTSTAIGATGIIYFSGTYQSV